jgi:hypothetical protein
LELKTLKSKLKSVFAPLEPAAQHREGVCCGRCGGSDLGATTEDLTLIHAFQLASLLTAAPGSAFPELARALAARAGRHVDPGLAPWLYPSPAELEILRAAHIELVEPVAWGAARLEDYRDVDPDFADEARVCAAPGQISVMLEFYARILARNANVGDAKDTRSRHLRNHLGPLALALADDPEIAAHRFYGGVFGWCRRLVLGECTALGVVPAKLPREVCGRGCG